jgi:glycosyltransferase involved in cell wall biosynthesis
MFSVCIATVRPNALLAAVESIRRQTWQDWELIIVSQGNDPTLAPTLATIVAIDPRIRHIHLERKSTSLARNTAIQAACGKWIAITDDDCEASSDWLAVIAEYFESGQGIGVVGGSLIVPPREHKIGVCPGLEPEETLYDSTKNPQQPPPGWDWVGANFAITSELAARVGPFDECLGPGTDSAAAEDTDYKLRLEKIGAKMVATPRSKVYHTYGYRYGIKAMLRHSYNYARGNGFLAAKLTLSNDPRGKEWVDKVRRLVIEPLRNPRKIHRLPLAIYRLRNYLTGYRTCLANYTVDQASGLLRRAGS